MSCSRWPFRRHPLYVWGKAHPKWGAQSSIGTVYGIQSRSSVHVDMRERTAGKSGTWKVEKIAWGLLIPFQVRLDIRIFYCLYV